MNLEIKRASDIPEKYSYKTKAMYNWLDENKTPFESDVVERSKVPDFRYKGEHTITITEELCEFMRLNTLKIGIWGMIESKKDENKNDAGKKKKRKEENGPAEPDEPELQLTRQGTSDLTNQKMMTGEQRLAELEK